MLAIYYRLYYRRAGWDLARSRVFSQMLANICIWTAIGRRAFGRRAFGRRAFGRRAFGRRAFGDHRAFKYIYI